MMGKEGMKMINGKKVVRGLRKARNLKGSSEKDMKSSK